MFTPDTLKFLRALTRNNDREWFKARKDKYEAHVRGPMIAVILAIVGGLNSALQWLLWVAIIVAVIALIVFLFRVISGNRRT